MDYKTLMAQTSLQLEAFLSRRTQELLEHDLRQEVEMLAHVICVSNLIKQYERRRLTAPPTLYRMLDDAKYQFQASQAFRRPDAGTEGENHGDLSRSSDYDEAVCVPGTAGKNQPDDRS